MALSTPAGNLRRAASKKLPSILATAVAAITGILFGLLGLDGDVRFDPLPTLAYIVILGSALLSIAYELISTAQELPVEFLKDNTYDSNIQQFMQDWLTGEGRSAIFSRDLSWAEDPGIKAFLLTQAPDLLILVANATDTARELAIAGAEVVEYNPVLATPSSRFTIINYGNATSAQVAIGRSQTKVHQIERFSAGEHPAFHLADDLVTLARATGTRI